jgi:lipid-A-disaccharide synthase
MRRLSIMLVAGEPSGDLLAAEFVDALRDQLSAAPRDIREASVVGEASLEPVFFGAGGPKMKAAGVEILHDLTARSVIGPTEVVANYAAFRRVFKQLIAEARTRQPDVVILVDFSHFNQRLGEAIRRVARTGRRPFHNWMPLLVKYVSPQVWASRPGRSAAIARTFDLLLSILPFEQAWYAKREPRLKTVYVGHWIMDRYPATPIVSSTPTEYPPLMLLLPGSRPGEIRRHAGVLVQSVTRLRQRVDVRAVLAVPNQSLAELVQRVCGDMGGVKIEVGNLGRHLQSATMAIAATGSVTLECARFGLPTVAIYKTSWLTYQIAKRLITVSYLSMPNLLANEPLFPEFIQDKATPEAISEECVRLLTDERRRAIVKERLQTVIQSLGNGGAGQRAAEQVLQLLKDRSVAF